MCPDLFDVTEEGFGIVRVASPDEALRGEAQRGHRQLPRASDHMDRMIVTDAWPATRSGWTGRHTRGARDERLTRRGRRSRR